MLAAIGLGPLVAREAQASFDDGLLPGLPSRGGLRFPALRGISGRTTAENISGAHLAEPCLLKESGLGAFPSEPVGLEIKVDLEPAIANLKRFEEAIASATRAMAAFNVEAENFKAEHPELAYSEDNPAMIARDMFKRAGHEVDEDSFAEAARAADRAQ
jgi:hypothetical protein